MCVVFWEIKVKAEDTRNSCNHLKQNFLPITLSKIDLVMQEESRHGREQMLTKNRFGGFSFNPVMVSFRICRYTYLKARNVAGID